jgi:hypothetical protein
MLTIVRSPAIIIKVVLLRIFNAPRHNYIVYIRNEVALLLATKLVFF